jgi:hypothetical protein
MPRPDNSRIYPYFIRYIDQVEEDDLMTALHNQASSFEAFLLGIPDSKRLFRYAEGKWSIQEVLQHIIDSERIFAYRALCFSRKETQPLPGFDENTYADNSAADSRHWNDLVEEFKTVRKSTEILFASFTPEHLEAGGFANGNPNYVLALGFIMAGHVNHHAKVIKERYL